MDFVFREAVQSFPTLLRLSSGSGSDLIEAHAQCTSKRAQGGAFLIEALVAMVVFLLAAAGVFAALANALHASSNASLRSSASNLVASTLAYMQLEDPATLAGRYDSNVAGNGYTRLATFARRFPGVTATSNQPLVSVNDGVSSASRRVSVTVFWQLPDESRPHRTTMTTVVAPR